MTTLPDCFDRDGTQHNLAPSGWFTERVHLLEPTGNSGGWISSFDSTGLDIGTVRELDNDALYSPTGVVVLRHEYAVLDANDQPLALPWNRIICPNDTDFVAAKGTTTTIRLTLVDGAKRWRIIGHTPRHRRVITQGLGIFPPARMPPISGDVIRYNPTPVSVGNRIAASGLGADGGSLACEDSSSWSISASAPGARVRSMLSIGHVDANTAGQGGLRYICNDGPFTITWEHATGVEGESLNRLWCPGGVDYDMLPDSGALFMPRESGGWNIVAQGALPRQFIQRLRIGRASYAPPAILDVTIPAGTIDNLVLPDASLVRVDVAGNGEAIIRSIAAPGLASDDWLETRLLIYGGRVTFRVWNLATPGNGIWTQRSEDVSYDAITFASLQYDPLNGRTIVGAS